MTAMPVVRPKASLTLVASESSVSIAYARQMKGTTQPRIQNLSSGVAGALKWSCGAKRREGGVRVYGLGFHGEREAVGRTVTILPGVNIMLKEYMEYSPTTA